jgi:hypothetical protein
LNTEGKRIGEARIERLLLLERLVWERVNDQRHRRYPRAWKDSYRRWWKEKEWEWPASEPFWRQHQRVLKAAHDHRLTPKPLAELSRAELVATAVQRLAEMGFPEDEAAEVLPPVDELLP